LDPWIRFKLERKDLGRTAISREKKEKEEPTLLVLAKQQHFSDCSSPESAWNPMVIVMSTQNNGLSSEASKNIT